MPYRRTAMACILAFACGVLFFSFAYGPHRRTYAAPPRVVDVENEAEIYRLWNSAGLKGRIVILFSSSLNAQVGMNTSDDYIELALRHGIVRTVWQVVPDGAWPRVFAEDLDRQMPSPVKVTDTNFAMLLEAGRINVTPLSKFWPMDEKVVIVVEPDAWSLEERAHIARLMSSGRLATDLVLVVRGASSEKQRFQTAMKGL